MFYIKDPSTLCKPWILSKKTDENPHCIPIEITQSLKNYHIMAIEFLYHNYRKGIKGSILNQDKIMNFPLQISALLTAILNGPDIILVICPRESICFWYYHLVKHGGFKVVQVTAKNSKDKHEVNDEKIALLLDIANLKLCEDFDNLDFFTVVIENLDEVATKLIIRRVSGRFNIGLTCRSFYTDPDQKLQWKMLNWACPGCVGKLHEFYEIDNRNFGIFEDNYRHWWLRLTWQFCESFKKPTDEELENYEKAVSDWGIDNSLNFPSGVIQKKPQKRKHSDKTISKKKSKIEKALTASDSSSDTIINEVPIDKYVKLPSMDENPILTSIIKNFEISPEPIITHSYESYSLTQPNCSKAYQEDNSIILSFMDNKERPSTSKCDSEEFIVNLIKKSDDDTNKKDIKDILKKADAVLQN